MIDSTATPDLYAVLQVDPAADQDVIEAAYRQLMKKHHPDVAGADPVLAAQYTERAKLINQAHSILRDPVQRRKYDALRGLGGFARGAAPRSGVADSARSTFREQPQAAPAWTQAPPPWTQTEEVGASDGPRGPLGAAVAAYYLLPGPYEWEGGRRQDLLATCLLPPVGIAAFALATGRLAPIVGDSFGATIVAWGIVLLLMLPIWPSWPRLATASVPTLALLSGAGDFVLREASVPAWLAWALIAILSVLLSARLYLFAVLPTIGACWLLSRLG